MKQVVEKLCIICWTPFYRYRRDGDNAKVISVSPRKHSIRTRNTNTCNKQCSKYYNRGIAFYRGKSECRRKEKG